MKTNSSLKPKKQLFCAICGSKYVVNVHFCLCDKCNKERLKEANSKNASQKISTDKQKLKKSNKPSAAKLAGRERARRQIELDEQTYYEVFSSRPHECEECRYPLPDQFRDEDGKVVARWQYSHTVPKSVAPELRNNPEAINRLCIGHHDAWEHGSDEDLKKMRIYEGNAKKFPKYF